MQPVYSQNLNLDNIVTLIRIQRLEEMLCAAGYDPKKIEFLKKGFTEGFDIGYKGPINRQSRSNNIPLKIGSKTELWNKIMKEIQLNRVAGPFDSIPFWNFIQSPISLVPKDGGTKTRLIFHLSFDFDKGKHGKHTQQFKSLNYYTPKELCSGKYNDLDCAVKSILSLARQADVNMQDLDRLADNAKFKPVYCGKTDVQSAFPLVLLSKWSWQWLIFKAQDPLTGQWKYFVDKCLPFGASISCAIFQSFSDALKFVAEWRSNVYNALTNYLDDFLFAARTLAKCNQLMHEFLDLCAEVGILISPNKTEWETLTTVYFRNLT